MGPSWEGIWNQDRPRQAKTREDKGSEGKGRERKRKGRDCKGKVCKSEAEYRRAPFGPKSSVIKLARALSVSARVMF